MAVIHSNFCCHLTAFRQRTIVVVQSCKSADATYSPSGEDQEPKNSPCWILLCLSNYVLCELTLLNLFFLSVSFFYSVLYYFTFCVFLVSYFFHLSLFLSSLKPDNLVPRLRARRSRNHISISDRGKWFCLFQSFQNISEAYPTFCSWISGACSSRVRRLKCKADH